LQPEAQEWAFRAGLAALLMLMIFVTLNDLASFGLWRRLGGLIG
jgi:regulator of sigma E protease